MHPRGRSTAIGAVAMGEIGLDYHYDFAPRDVQREVFAAQVALALDRDLPVVIHTREAADDTIAVLRDAGRAACAASCTASAARVDEARQALDLGFYVSFSGIVTFPKGRVAADVARVRARRSPARRNRRAVSGARAASRQAERAGLGRADAATLAAARGVTPAALAEQIAANFARMLVLRTRALA